MKITVSGLAGAGKSSIVDYISSYFELEKKDVGKERRIFAENMKQSTLESSLKKSDLNDFYAKYPNYKNPKEWNGISLQALNYLTEKNDLFDTMFDMNQRRFLNENDNYVISGRMSHHFTDDAYKIFLYVSPEEGARRIYESQEFKDGSRNETSTTLEEMVKSNKRRDERDAIRYKKLYGVDHRTPSQYDLFIDTTNLSQDEVKEMVKQKVEDFYAKKKIEYAFSGSFKPKKRRKKWNGYNTNDRSSVTSLGRKPLVRYGLE